MVQTQLEIYFLKQKTKCTICLGVSENIFPLIVCKLEWKCLFKNHTIVIWMKSKTCFVVDIGYW